MPHNQVVSFRTPLKQLAWMVFRNIGAPNAVWKVMIASELPLVGFVVLWNLQANFFNSQKLRASMIRFIVSAMHILAFGYSGVWICIHCRFVLFQQRNVRQSQNLRRGFALFRNFEKNCFLNFGHLYEFLLVFDFKRRFHDKLLLWVGSTLFPFDQRCIHTGEEAVWLVLWYVAFSVQLV